MSYNQDVILDAIQAHPGCTASDIARYTGIGSVNKPLRALVRDKRARFEMEDHNRKRYWAIP
jgi:hypothetical protein